MLMPETPEHAQAGSDCLDCHVGHGSAKPGLLRDQPLSATAPGTAPATAPATAPTGAPASAEAGGPP